MTELTGLKGIGEKTAGALMRLGISCAEDLIYYFPRDYIAFGHPKEIGSLTPGTTEAVECLLTSDASINRYNGMTIVNLHVSDLTGRLQISWDNMPYIKQTLRAGSCFVFRGRIYEKGGRLIMGQPKIYRPEDYKKGYEGRLMPVYRLSKGISNNLLMKAVASVLRENKPSLLPEEFLPAGILGRIGLEGEAEALRDIHFPRDLKSLTEARKRLSFDELFMFFILQKKRKQLFLKKASEYRCRPDLRFIQLAADLPFELTRDQSEALKTITRDMSSGNIMNRLLEGDVGSGKTIVAFLAMAYAGFCGYQSAMLAPTEVLARQHYDKLTGLIGSRDLPLKAVLLCGSMQKAQKEETLRLIREHEADIIIGTHALFQERVDYDRLGLVVTDEQHRFGVSQREAMKQKGGLPHMLFMSATPIPRTLSMILYGDMDVSVISMRPEGRIPIKNAVVNPSYRKNAYKFIYDEVRKGHRAYVVCPSIAEEDEEGSGPSGSFSAGLETVEETYKKLRKLFPGDIGIGMLHGRMKPEDKEAAMQAFKDGQTDILVCTTVVEVGVDVPEATVIMIENAERFGLSQLHQLRGRVGRGHSQSYCIMVNTSDGEEARERLSILRDSNDGFFIASEDLRLRGPGDLFGVRQSGEMGFLLADIYRDRDLLKPAADEAEALLEGDPELMVRDHEGIRKKLSYYMDNSYYV